MKDRQRVGLTILLVVLCALEIWYLGTQVPGGLFRTFAIAVFALIAVFGIGLLAG